MDIKELKWDKIEHDSMGLAMFACNLGPYRAFMMQAAMVSLNMEFICAVLDMRSNKTIWSTTKSFSQALVLQTKANGEDLIKKILVELGDTAGVKLIELYNEWMVEQIILGGNGEI